MPGKYTDQEIQDLEVKKTAQIFKELLWRVKDEEPELYSNIEETCKKEEINFKDSFLMFSEGQVYKSYSIYGIMNNFNKRTKFKVVDLALLLDIWFNENTLYTKTEIITCDILILHGVPNKSAGSSKARVLLELLSTRKTMRKITWIFLEQSNMKKFEKLSPGVIGNVKEVYTSSY